VGSQVLDYHGLDRFQLEKQENVGTNAFNKRLGIESDQCECEQQPHKDKNDNLAD
jgi:hypothetical protein